jgi:hypothetical protein
MEREVEIDWEAEYIGWQKSGLSQREYSEKSGYTLAVFKNGMTRTGCRKRLKKRPATTKPIFVALKSSQVTAPERAISPEAYCEIRFSGKPGLRIESSETMDQLRTLVKGLWGQC